MLLAASVPIRSGPIRSCERVLEAGTGAGAALLCLSARARHVCSTGVESDETIAELAAANARANGFTGIQIMAGRIEGAVFPRTFDHAIANPPYHSTGGTASPIAARETAKRGSDGLIATWIGCLAGALRDRGSLTLIVPAGIGPFCLATMAQSRCPCTILFPLWPKSGRPAKLVLLRGVKGARAPMRLMPGLVLHNPDGSFTDAAQAILAHGAALALDGSGDAQDRAVSPNSPDDGPSRDGRNCG